MSDLILIDTDVFSYFLKRDTRRVLFEPALRGARPAISLMTLAELRRWALAHAWGDAKRKALQGMLDRHLLLGMDEATADSWARIMVHRSRAGTPIQTGDCWVAATPLRHGLPLITHNVKDYRDIPGLTVISHASQA